MDKVLLIDGMNALYRASIGFGKKQVHSPIQSEYGIKCQCGGNWINGSHCEKDVDDSTVLVFNFFRNLRPIIELFSPDKCFFILEGHPQFRYDLYSEYKANRIIKTASKQEEKDKFYKAKEEVLRLIPYLPITTCRAEKYEADDVIATLCENLKDEHVTVLSSDSDYIQLLQKGYAKCEIYNPIKKEFMIAPTFPYIAWKSINGDKSDNIPSLLKPKKVLECMSNPDKFAEFLAVEENRAKFSINKQLIEFRMVPEDEIILSEGIKDFVSLKTEFQKLKFESITNEKSWAKYTKTFDCIKY